MRIFLLLTLVFPSLAFAGLVEVNSSQYLRESGNPQAQHTDWYKRLEQAADAATQAMLLDKGVITEQ